MQVYEDQIVLPLATYGGAGPINSPDQRAFGASGLYIVLHVKTAGTTTLALRIEGKEPFEGTYYQTNVDVTVTTAVRHMWIMGKDLAKTPPGEAAATIQSAVRQLVAIPPPDTFRISIAKGDTSDWVFGVTVRRVP